jgi:pimeloyl-ACP methyl ester carboxylesterase
MATFVLIHGAWHGSWCWIKVANSLRKAGHRVITPDLPGHGDDKTPIAEVSLAAYADCVCEAVNQAEESVVLVGHSMGGIAITQAAENCPDNIRALVFLSAFLLPDGATLLETAASDTDVLVLPNLVMSDDQRYATVKDEVIAEAFYADCDASDVSWAKQQLLPEATAPFATPIRTTAGRFGRIPRIYISCTEDRAISPALQSRMIDNLGCQKVISMATSHSPFLSEPVALCEHLMSL